MKRRTVLLSLSAIALGVARHGSAQPATRVYRVAALSVALGRNAPFYVAMVRRFNELGYVEGKNFAFEFRTLGGHWEKMPGVVTELVGTRPDIVIAAGSERLVREFRQATGTTPIVMIAVDFDPVERNFIATLARPGGNITGLVFRQLESSAKRLELLKESMPKATRVAALFDIATRDQLHATEQAAKKLAITVLPYEMRGNPYDFAAALGAAAKAKAHAVQVLSSGAFLALSEQLFGAALKHRLPVFANPNYAEAGALVSFGASFPHMYARAAEYADRILKGAKPAEMPVEQPTKFELIVNKKSAKLLGITIPPSVLLRADRVIE